MSARNAPSGTLRDVAPAGPVAAWFGGKKLLARRIAERIDAIPHDCYAEPFVGMGGVLLRKRRRPKSEIVNDINADIVNLFRVMREHADELIRQFEWSLSAREEFRRLIDVPPETLTDVQRAARFVYLQKLAFGGKPAIDDLTPGQMGPSVHHGSKVTPGKMRRLIAAAHRRLQEVHVERLEWDVFIRRYDRPFTLFYIDPPYFGHENDYGRGLFARQDFARMAELLGKLKGRFILSLNDRPEVRALFAGCEFEEVTVRYSANAKAQKQAPELLISGGGKGRLSGARTGLNRPCAPGVSGGLAVEPEHPIDEANLARTHFNEGDAIGLMVGHATGRVFHLAGKLPSLVLAQPVFELELHRLPLRVSRTGACCAATRAARDPAR